MAYDIVAFYQGLFHIESFFTKKKRRRQLHFFPLLCKQEKGTTKKYIYTKTSVQKKAERGDTLLICMQDSNLKLGPRTKGATGVPRVKNLDQYS